MKPEFFVGLHQPSDARHFSSCCLSVRRLKVRRKPVGARRVIVDSGAFTELDLYGEYREPVEVYAAHLARLWHGGVVAIVGAVAQDYMCEPFMLAKTGLSVCEHQRLTIERYDALLVALAPHFPDGIPFDVLPVIQGYQPEEYARHVADYGDRLTPGMWVGVGSVCKRNGRPEAIVRVLSAILAMRPDLRLHGFGVKRTALLHPGVRDMLATADSLAWSDAARKAGGNPNDYREAERFVASIDDAISRAAAPWQLPLL